MWNLISWVTPRTIKEKFGQDRLTLPFMGRDGETARRVG